MHIAGATLDCKEPEGKIELNSELRGCRGDH